MTHRPRRRNLRRLTEVHAGTDHGVEPLLTLEQAAELTGQTEEQLRARIASGELPAAQLPPGQWRLRPSDVASLER